MIKVDLGNTRGIKRKLDSLGRIVLPKTFRDELGIKNNDKVDVYLLEEGFYITKK